MLIDGTMVAGIEPAFQGMRNPRNSWDKSTSTFGSVLDDQWEGEYFITYTPERPNICDADLELAGKLIKAGTEHRKFLRQISIWVDMTLPRYVWTEFDTYKIGVTRNSCSTMHKILYRTLTQDDFEEPIFKETLLRLNSLITLAQADKKVRKQVLFEVKNNLPEGFLQRATLSLNYEVALNMFHQRKNHRLPEWALKSDKLSICKWIADLPYMDQFL